MSLKHRFAHPRYARLNKLLRKNQGDIILETMRAIQRDHFEGEIIGPRWSPADGLHVSICMHAMLETASKTAAAAQVELTPDKEPIWFNAFACPCVSVFAPYAVSAQLPAAVSTAGAQFDANSAWWQFERLQYAIERDYPRYIAKWKPVAAALEEEMLSEVRQRGTVDAEMIARNTEKLLQAVDHAYHEILASTEGSAQPQHESMNEAAMRRAGITF